jgi:hypothetical protein
MTSITRGLPGTRIIWIDHARGGAARCRGVALRQRRVAAFVIAASPACTGFAGSYVWAAAGPTDIVPIAKIAKARMRIRTSLWIVLPFRPRPDFQMKETSP